VKTPGTILFYWITRIALYSVISLIACIILKIAYNGLPVISWSYLTEFPREGGGAGGIFPAIVGTLCLIVGTTVVSIPLGVATAIYLNEYASRRFFIKVVERSIFTLAGVPPIVFGLFGLGVFVYFLGFGSSILSGSLTLACMMLPMVIVTTKESLKSVPNTIREASLALGATKWETIRKNVLPYSLPGILTGSILGIGRIAGETAPILFTATAFLLPELPSSIFDQVMTLPYHLYILSTQHPNQEVALPMQYGVSLVLLMLVVLTNSISIIVRSIVRSKYKW
jgi:phosphate transport system permease protein